MNRFESLGVVTDKIIPTKEKVEQLLNDLNVEFNGQHTTKEKIVAVIKEYLPNFEHIETGKSL